MGGDYQSDSWLSRLRAYFSPASARSRRGKSPALRFEGLEERCLLSSIDVMTITERSDDHLANVQLRPGLFKGLPESEQVTTGEYHWSPSPAFRESYVLKE